MATTTNYGWTTPDDTALVKDGAAAIRTLGSSVDTTTKNLNPSTTLGDIEYRSSTPNVNTRLPLGTAGQVLKVNSGATAPEWATDASGMTNPMTTTGDTIYSSSGSTPARLGIGTAGQVLRVNSGATAPEWAAPSTGAMTLVQRSTFSNVANTGTTFDGVFTTTYNSYVVVFEKMSAATNSNALHMQFRYAGPTTQTTNYYGNALQLTYDSATITNATANNAAEMVLNANAGDATALVAGTLNVFNVGYSGNPKVSGFFMDANSNKNSIVNYNQNNARTYTGFLLKSSSTNITGTVAVYGLA
jgi:hypothetical protein